MLLKNMVELVGMLPKHMLAEVAPACGVICTGIALILSLLS